ncbi:MAG: patatin-like phospholipase family protein [Oscillochloris sp.]|nr:patatin-like phospholipase family protein [Oscillochloris sp.]
MSSDNHSWLAQLRKQFGWFVPEPQQPQAPESRRLGLALGGGGGKGAAHLGVIQVLEELHIPIDLLVGTSIGGAVAIFHAAGLSDAEVRDIFRNTELRRIAVPDPTRTGLIGQHRRAEILKSLLSDRTFADLSIPCAVVATDLITGTIVVINEGSLVEAILATTALPSLFPPVVSGERVLVDGGVLNNLPVDVAVQMGADKVIAVELNDAVASFSLLPFEAENPISRLLLAPQQLSIANRSLSLLINHATRLHLEAFPPALLISPQVSDIPTLDTTNPERGQQAGIMAARATASKLLELRSWRTDSAPPTESQIAAALPSGTEITDWPEELDHAAEQPPPLRHPLDMSAWWDEVFGSGRSSD